MLLIMMMNNCAYPTCHIGDKWLPEGSQHIFIALTRYEELCYCIAIVCRNNSFWVSYNGVVFAWLSVIAVMANRVDVSSAEMINVCSCGYCNLLF